MKFSSFNDFKKEQLPRQLFEEIRQQKDFAIQGNSGKWIPSPKNGECGARLTSETVIGGDEAKLGEFPYIALLGYLLNDEMYYLCGGSVLNTKYILTAAHCNAIRKIK